MICTSGRCWPSGMVGYSDWVCSFNLSQSESTLSLSIYEPTFRWNVALILPKDMPFSYAAAVDLHYTKHKSYWPVGGASEIPFHMVPVIEMSGKTLSVLS